VVPLPRLLRLPRAGAVELWPEDSDGKIEELRNRALGVPSKVKREGKVFANGMF